jgi:glycosyltransferase involved in cell wall biosynthesis
MSDQINNPVPLLTIVVPCYNEEQILTFTQEKLTVLLLEIIAKGKVAEGSFISFIDDGSKDTTWELIHNFSQEHKHIRGVKLSRNFGHQGALLAGIYTYVNEADCIVTIDADLQDDVNAIEQMVDAYREGYDIVYGVRKERKSDTYFKRNTAVGFYKIMKKLGVEIIFNHADFRLTSRRVLQQLCNFNEVNLFLRGIFPLIGFPSKIVFYNRSERLLGESKYPFKKMLEFALEGISSFSVKPLRLVSLIGIFVFFLCLLMAGYSFISWLYLGTVPGWTSITLPIYFISGVQIFCIGIIAEYVGKVYSEIKSRPRFIIEKKED